MRSTRFGPLIALAFLISVASAQAQQSATTTPLSPTRDVQAVLVLQTAVKAMGGGAPSDSTATGSVTETVGSDSQEGTIQILTRGSDESLETVELPDLSQTTVYSGGLAGQTSGSAAQQQLSGQLAVTSQTVLNPLPFVAGALSNPDDSLQYVGQEVVDGVTTQHIRLWNTFASKPRLQMLAQFSVHDVWMNAANGLHSRFRSRARALEGRRSKRWLKSAFLIITRLAVFPIHLKLVSL